MLTKKKVIESLNNFPDTFTVDELIDKMILIDKIERGNQQSENGETISEIDLDKEIQEWLK